MGGYAVRSGFRDFMLDLCGSGSGVGLRGGWCAWEDDHKFFSEMVDNALF